MTTIYRLCTVLILAICLIGCKAQGKLQAEDQREEPNFVELDLYDNLDPQRMVTAFGPAYGLLYECKVNKEKNIVIYSFNKEKISLVDIISDLRFEVGVESAEASNGCSLD